MSGEKKEWVEQDGGWRFRPEVVIRSTSNINELGKWLVSYDNKEMRRDSSK